MHQFFHRLSRAMAYLGGLMLVVLIVIICTSILGRSMNGILHSDQAMSVAPTLARWLIDAGIGPITGDFELVEAGVAFAIFAFLPWCQMTGGHASVDVFASLFPARLNRVLQMLIDLLFAFVVILIAVQLFGGLQSKLRSGQTSFLLEFPVWWGYALCMSGAVAAAGVSVYIAVMRVLGVVTGRDLLPHMEGAEN